MEKGVWSEDVKRRYGARVWSEFEELSHLDWLKMHVSESQICLSNPTYIQLFLKLKRTANFGVPLFEISRTFLNSIV